MWKGRSGPIYVWDEGMDKGNEKKFPFGIAIFCVEGVTLKWVV